MLRFGFPLLIAELIDQALAFSDRYFIAYFLGVTAVGHYASAYNFIFNVQSVMISSFSLTIAPAVVQKYRAEQDPGVQDFLEKSLKIYCAIGSAVALGLFSVGADTFILMASDRYQQAEPLIKPIVAGYFLYGVYTIAAYKMFIHKQTTLTATFMAMAAVVSILANIVLLPRVGVVGAAISTLLAYAVLAVIGLWLMWRAKWIIEMPALLPYCIPAGIMYAALTLLPASRDWASVGCRVLVGGAIWTLMAAVLFKEARQALAQAARRLAGQ